MLTGSGKLVLPRWLFVYYKTFDLEGVVARPPVANSETFPLGLGFLSKGAGSEPDYDYWCGSVLNNTSPELHRKSIPNCTEVVTQRIRFPFCWDGRLQSADNGHVVMPTGLYEGSVCPTSHGRRIPHIEFQLEYTVDGTTSDWFLSSDVDPVTNSVQEPRGGSAHGDWLNGWHPLINQLWVQTCTEINVDCTQNVFDSERVWFLDFHDKSRFTEIDSNVVPLSLISGLCPWDIDREPEDYALCRSAESPRRPSWSYRATTGTSSGLS